MKLITIKPVQRLGFNLEVIEYVQVQSIYECGKEYGTVGMSKR